MKESNIQKIKNILEEEGVHLSGMEFEELIENIADETAAITLATIFETAILLWGFNIKFGD
jgi:hypothetical protein